MEPSLTEPGEVLLLRKALTEAVADLTHGRRLTVVELAAAGIVTWEVRRDPADVPRGRTWPLAPWPATYDEGGPADRAIIRAGRLSSGDDDITIVVSTFADPAMGAAALRGLRRARPDIQHFSCPTAQVNGLLREVIADDPLTRFYELVTLSETRSGRLELGCALLFPIGAQRGATAQLTLRCENSDDLGTTFAVVAASPDERLFNLAMVRSAKAPPGVYRLTAELRRPGLVRFHGLPTAPVRDERAWSELVAAVPDRLVPPPAAAHLICAVEISGPAGRPERVVERISRASQVISTAAEGRRGGLRVSVLSFGPHAFERNALHGPVDFLCWNDAPETALDRLPSLAALGALTGGYPHAAQIECALTRVADRLDEGFPGVRTALVTIGGRPPFPARTDPSEILPCPGRNDWAAALARLRGDHGVAMAAICDTLPASDRIWHELGGGSPAPLDTVSPQQLCRSLGLAPSVVQCVPFPFVEPE
jgi:hypothetical protein